MAIIEKLTYLFLFLFFIALFLAIVLTFIFIFTKDTTVQVNLANNITILICSAVGFFGLTFLLDYIYNKYKKL